MSRVLLDFRRGFPGLREGFEALGHEVVENAAAEDPAQSLEGVVLAVADFVDSARRVRRTLALKRRLARAGARFVALSRDAPWHRGVHRARLAALAWLAPFDGYAAHSLQGAERFARHPRYCPNAARERYYRVGDEELRAMRDPGYHRWDVSFVGNLDTARYPEHARRAGFLAALAARLAALGVSTHFRDAAGLDEAAQVEIIKRSRISLSAFAACDAGAQPSWGLPERCYGVPACGGLLLSDRRRHAAEDFSRDEWVDFADLDECLERIRELAAAPARARAIAEAARARVSADHTYRERAARLLDFTRDAR